MSKTSKFVTSAFLGAGLVAEIAAASAEPVTTPPAPSDKSMMQDGMMPMMQDMSKMRGELQQDDVDHDGPAEPGRIGPATS
ncbi:MULTISPECIES: hypothetical protein [Methylorubrum]|uniref:Pentapeptide MXKDX repeat protein n=2 Tax=Methylorubrum TaxID=2282523 RepID=A0ABU9ZL66_9HYPH|nr:MULTISPECIES: hypothetical protein [Methylorubrum]MBD8908903.1 hypothetical protein [Methylorubrum zatmanii]MBK3406605.1 hypothetical protein [Methylorubrum rhodesianum]MBY0138842.1 hypothetical protein [Methylorubrum populi]MDV2988358.1 hypothetical protein [Methylobacteriaceae bacterium AG10]